MASSSRQQKSPPASIQLDGTVLLTEAGVMYCRKRSIPLHDLRTRNGRSGSGFLWRHFQLDAVNRFITHELLSQIDIERAEFLSRRREIMILTRESIAGILMKRFRPELKQLIRESRVFDSIRDRVMNVPRERIKAYLDRYERAIRVLRHSLLFEPSNRIEQDSALDREEKQERIARVEQIVASIDGETWFLLSLVPSGRDREDLMRTIHELLLTYVARFRVADFVALILMELLEYAERTQLLNFAERDQYIRTHPEELASRLADAEFREKLFQRARQTRSLLNLSYRFTGNPYNITRTAEVEIAVVNRGLVGYESRREILARRHRNISTVQLAKFYEHENPSQFDTTLGSFYLASVEEACRAVGISFNAELTRNESSEETITLLRISL